MYRARPASRLLLTTLATLALGASPARAQSSASYVFPLGDTLRYVEVSHTDQKLETAQGTMPGSLDHRAVVAMTSAGFNQNLNAWYDSLGLSATGPGGTQAASTAELLHNPFTISVSPRGVVAVKSVPAIPEDVAGLSDLSHEFDDFLISLPAAELKPGVTWQDTVRSTASADTAVTVSFEAVRSFTVRGDTTVAAGQAVVIEVKTDIRLNSSGPVPGQPMTAVNTLSGTEEGVALFDVAQGRMIARTKSGTLGGTLVLQAPQGTAELAQTLTYTSTIRPVG